MSSLTSATQWTADAPVVKTPQFSSSPSSSSSSDSTHLNTSQSSSLHASPDPLPNKSTNNTLSPQDQIVSSSSSSLVILNELKKSSTTSNKPADTNESLQSVQVVIEDTNNFVEYSVPSAINNNSNNSATMEASLHPVLKSFLVGSISGTCSTVIFQPLDLLKTRLQAPVVGRGTGMLTIMGTIVRDEKISGLWKGMTPSLTRCVPGVGLYFGSIHGLKILMDIKSEPTALQSVILGATARSISGVAMIPFTVIKTRFESKFYQYGSIREALTLIYQREGMRGLTCGLLPTLLRDAPFSALYLMMYTWTKQKVPKDWIESGVWSPYTRFSCGIVAGVGASLVTQPFDVVKTKMQLFPNRFPSIPAVIVYIYETYGMQGYLKGLMPRMVRRTLIAAMSWTVYEQLMKNIGLK